MIKKMWSACRWGWIWEIIKNNKSNEKLRSAEQSKLHFRPGIITDLRRELNTQKNKRSGDSKAKRPIMQY